MRRACCVGWVSSSRRDSCSGARNRSWADPSVAEDDAAQPIELACVFGENACSVGFDARATLHGPPVEALRKDLVSICWLDREVHHGPELFWRDDIPRTELTPVRPGDELPGGLLALYDGRGRMETPLYLPEQRALVFADGMTAPGGVLRVWWSPTLQERTLPALRAMLDLPFERVLVSHGEPVHERADFEAALEREPWSRPSGA